MWTRPPSWKARSVNLPCRRLARGATLVRELDAVVDGVADEVQERVAQRLVDRLVDADVFAFDLDPDLLAHGRRQVADDAAELAR